VVPGDAGMSIEVDKARDEFRTHFSAVPELVARAPGRVNIIGEHTDYNEGFVLPMAIERETLIVARGRDDGRLRAYASNPGRAASGRLGRFERNAASPWLDYVVGVARELDALGRPLRGADLLILGDVPIGAGLSSSASLEMAALVMFEHLGGFALAGETAAQLGKRVENEFLGVNSGIMDQFVVRMANAGHALFLDCRTYEHAHVPVAFAGATFVIAHTGVSRGLSGSQYNVRVRECGEAAAIMGERLGRDGAHLRDYMRNDLLACEDALPETVLRRARHVITENERTQAAREAMGAGDAAALGCLMNASDASLRDDYEVTCLELDAMTSIARGVEGCFGSRMTGAGFGGCTVSLVASDAATAFGEELLDRYGAVTGLTGCVIHSAPAGGAELIL